METQVCLEGLYAIKRALIELSKVSRDFKGLAENLVYEDQRSFLSDLTAELEYELKLISDATIAIERQIP